MTSKTPGVSRRHFLAKGATVAAGAAALAAPATIASASTPINLRLQTAYPVGTWHYDSVVVDLADRVRAATAGEINIEVFPTGAIVPTLEMFTAAGRGLLDAAFIFPGNWIGQVPSAGHLAGNVGTFDSLEEAWYFYYETEALSIIQEAYAERGVHLVGPVASSGLTFFGKRPIRTLADFRGNRIRSSGNAQRVFERMGSSPVTVPGAELFHALQTGVVETAHWGGVSAGMNIGFGEVTAFIMKPDIVYPYNMEVFFSQRRWNSLGEDHRQIITDVVRAIPSAHYHPKNLYYETVDTNRFINDHGGEVVHMEDEVLELMRVSSMQIVDEISAADPRYSGRVGQLLHEFMRFTGKI